MEAPQGGSDRDKSTSSSGSSLVPVFASFPKDFDTEKEISILDEQGLRITENQENSNKNCQKLAESTRDFEQASAEEKLILLESLLEGYQEEVDNLTKRAEFGENAFLEIYQKLYEGLGHYAALDSVADQDLKFSKLKSENQKIKHQMEEFRTEATCLKNQQAAIIELCKRELEQKMDEKKNEILEIQQLRLDENGENQRQMEVLKEREIDLYGQLQKEMDRTQRIYQSFSSLENYMFKSNEEREEEKAAMQLQINLLEDEVEQAGQRLGRLEIEKGFLLSRLKLANEETERKIRDIMKDLNDEEKILPELYVDLHKIHTTLSNEQEKHGSEIKKLNTLLDEKEAVLEETKEALRTSQARLVNQLRHEKLKSLVFGKTVSVLLEKKRKLKDEPNQLEEAVLGEIKKALQNSPTAKLVNDMRQEKQKSLVLGRAVPILLEKNRILKDASTQLEVKLLEKTSSLETAEGNIAELTAKVIEKQKLIQKLKEDVLKYARDVETLNLDIESKFKKKYEDEERDQ